MEMTRDMVQEILSREAYLCDGYFRIRAIESADIEFLPRLREMFLDPNEGFYVHLAIAKALLRLGDSEFVERIAHDPEPRHPSTRVAAVRALGERYAPTPSLIARTLREVWREGDMWPQERQELQLEYLDALGALGEVDGIDVADVVDVVDLNREHPTVLKRLASVLIQLYGRDAAPVFARAFEEVRDTPYLALIYIGAIGEAGDPKYFEAIASYPDYVRQSAPHYYSDALAAVIGAAGRLAQYDWLMEIGRRDLFSARPAWLRALGEVAKRQPQHRDEIVAILRGYIRPRKIGPTLPDIVGHVVSTRHIGHPPGARLEDKPESYEVPCHNTAFEVLCELGEEVEV
jgi:hypothetical protein